MEILIDAVKEAINSKNWFAALFLSLTLPDICGSVENPKKKNGERYQDWYNRFILKKYPNFQAKDCWLLRNACLHEGSDRDVKMTFEKVHFIRKEKNYVIHNNVINNVLQLQVDEFCKDFCEGVEEWLKEISGDDEKKNRLNDLMNIHPVTSLKFIRFAQED